MIVETAGAEEAVKVAYKISVNREIQYCYLLLVQVLICLRIMKIEDVNLKEL